MKEPRLMWEPENRVPLNIIEERLSDYMKGKSGVSLLQNGTLLFIKSADDGDDETDAREAMEEAKFLTDFKVVELKEGGYLAMFHSAVAVFVGHEEFQSARSEIVLRIRELNFPSEQFFGADDEHFLVGLYARGKLQRDAHQFAFYKRIVSAKLN